MSMAVADEVAVSVAVADTILLAVHVAVGETMGLAVQVAVAVAVTLGLTVKLGPAVKDIVTVDVGVGVQRTPGAQADLKQKTMPKRLPTKSCPSASAQSLKLLSPPLGCSHSLVPEAASSP